MQAAVIERRLRRGGGRLGSEQRIGTSTIAASTIAAATTTSATSTRFAASTIDSGVRGTGD